MFDKLKQNFKTNMARDVNECKVKQGVKQCRGCPENSACYRKKYEVFV